MVHFHGEDLACARVRSCVSWQENHLLAWLHHTLLHTPREHITNTLDLVDARDWHPHWRAHWSLGHAAHLVQHVIQSVNVQFVASDQNVHAAPPTHLLRFFQEVVTHPARDRENGRVLLNEVLLPTNLDQHALHLIRDVIVTIFL